MTPITFLFLFCGVMSVIAVVRVFKAEFLTTDSELDGERIGAALVSVGVTLVAAFWMALEDGLGSWSLRVVVLGGGIALVLSGFVVFVVMDGR